PASVTVFRFAGLAEAKTSAGAPSLIWVASAELAAKLNASFAPGWADSKPLAIAPNASVSDAAAKTLTVPSTPEAPELGCGVAGSAWSPHAERPRTASAVSAGGTLRIQGRRVLTADSSPGRRRRRAGPSPP